MFQEIRIYKQYDTDLIALCAADYPVRKMIKQALVGFANKEPVSFDIAPLDYFDMNGKKTVRIRISISDEKVIRMLKNIKHGYRSNFCKFVLRNALPHPNPAILFADEMIFEEYKNVFAKSALKHADTKKIQLTQQMEVLQPFSNMAVPAKRPVMAIQEETPIVETEFTTIPSPPPMAVPMEPIVESAVSVSAMQDMDTGADSLEDDSIIDMFDNL